MAWMDGCMDRKEQVATFNMTKRYPGLGLENGTW